MLFSIFFTSHYLPQALLLSGKKGEKNTNAPQYFDKRLFKRPLLETLMVYLTPLIILAQNGNKWTFYSLF